MSPNDADGMANSVDTDQTAPVGGVWSGSALFAQAYLSENLGLLRVSFWQRQTSYDLQRKIISYQENQKVDMVIVGRRYRFICLGLL